MLFRLLLSLVFVCWRIVVGVLLAIFRVWIYSLFLDRTLGSVDVFLLKETVLRETFRMWSFDMRDTILSQLQFGGDIGWDN